MKLELKHLAPYLPYGLSYSYTNFDRISVLTTDVLARREKLRTISKLKPILRPLSDLIKEIEHNGEKFVPTDKLRKEVYEFENISIDLIMIQTFKGISFEWKAEDISNSRRRAVPYNFYEKLFEWHFDVFELIPAGLAIDLNKTSEENE